MEIVRLAEHLRCHKRKRKHLKERRDRASFIIANERKRGGGNVSVAHSRGTWFQKRSSFKKKGRKEEEMPNIK